MPKYYFLRHAESLANAKGIYQGQTYDTDLSERGKKQAALLSQGFKFTIGYVVTSPLKRTRATADALLKTTDAKLVIEPAIIETNHGLWEGKQKEDIQKNWLEMYNIWMTTPKEAKFPDGETFKQTQKRILDWWKDFNLDRNAAIVTHDNIIRIVLADTLGVDLNDIWKFNLLPTAVTTIEKNKNGARLIELNKVEHLGAEAVNVTAHAL